MSKKITNFYQLPVDLSWFLTLPLYACILSLAWSTLPLASWEEEDLLDTLQKGFEGLSLR
jgi:hypothetical protein